MNFPYDYRVAGELLGDEGTKATVLHAIILATYGAEIVYGSDQSEPWDPVLIFNQLEIDFSVKIPDGNENKINSILLAVSTDAFYTDVATFVGTCNVLDDGELGDLVVGILEDITMAEMLWACYEVLINRGTDDVDFAPAVMAVIEETINNEAEDKDGEPEDVLPGYENYLLEEREELIQQMERLGIPAAAIDHLRSISPSAGLNALAAEVEDVSDDVH